MATDILLGDEAVGLAAVHAGIAGAFGYPGTPATEIIEFIADRAAGGASIAAEWSPNEKVAYEAALGVSYAGRRAMVAFKHVGLNVAADPFMSSALTGVNAGLVVVVADDPGMHSSQNEQDSRFYGDFAQIPVLEPSNQQEAYDMTLYAFELSERFELPVMVRLVTRLAHSRSNVRTLDAPSAIAAKPRPPVRDPSDWTLLPVNARRRYRRLLEVQPALLAESEQSPFNALRLLGRRGIIASGIAWNYVREVLREESGDSLLKIATYPLPVARIRELVDHCEEIVVVEEGFPFIERQLRGLLGMTGKIIRGRLSGDVPRAGELSPDAIGPALGRARGAAPAAPPDVAARPPRLCDGCPHCDAFRALVEATAHDAAPILFSDIGCYTLGAMPPFRAVHSCVDMGASIAMAHGAALAGSHPVLCTIGDSTFAHSGMTSLLGAVRGDANMTVIILDNAGVAMTGGQETALTGAALMAALAGLGVRPEHLHCIEPAPKHHAENAALIRREIEHRGLSVIVAQRPCIHLRRRTAVETAVEAVV